MVTTIRDEQLTKMVLRFADHIRRLGGSPDVVKRATRAYRRYAKETGKSPRICYLVGNTTNQLVKIGTCISIGLRDRCIGLQCTSPVELVLVGFKFGEREKERRLRKRFATYRRHSEWFLIPEERMQKIKARRDLFILNKSLLEL